MPSANVTEAIDYLTEAVEGFTAVSAIIGSIGIVFFLILIFGIGAWWMTCCMFNTRNMVLGFVSAILWWLVGATFYQIPDMFDSDWFWVVNWWRLIAFAFFLIGALMPFAAYALRTKKEEDAEGGGYIDEGKDDIQFIDEGGKDTDDDEEKPSSARKALRDRADKRRSRY